MSSAPGPVPAVPAVPAGPAGPGLLPDVAPVLHWEGLLLRPEPSCG